MANSRAANTEAREPGISEYSRYVYGVVPNWFLPGEEALHCVQCRLPGSCYTDMLQRYRKLFVLGDSVRSGEV